jgi:hypothetical protein
MGSTDIDYSELIETDNTGFPIFSIAYLATIAEDLIATEAYERAWEAMFVAYNANRPPPDQATIDEWNREDRERMDRQNDGLAPENQWRVHNGLLVQGDETEHDPADNMEFESRDEFEAYMEEHFPDGEVATRTRARLRQVRERREARGRH